MLHPSHYEQGGVETIEVLEGVLRELYGDAGVAAWRLGNVLKYGLRAGHKGPMGTDVAKAANYANRYRTDEWMGARG